MVGVEFPGVEGTRVRCVCVFFLFRLTKAARGAGRGGRGGRGGAEESDGPSKAQLDYVEGKLKVRVL